MAAYKTPAERGSGEFTEKKSQFIGHISPAATEKEALDFIERIRGENRKANHNCYAYILRDNNISRHSDDGEPSGTGGAPIYDVLKKAGVTDVCVVVTRYFGGILLGAPGLTRAYAKGAKTALDSVRIKEMKMAERLEISLEYGLYGKLSAFLRDREFINEGEDFSDKVKVIGVLPEEQREEFSKQLIDLCNGRVYIKVVGSLEFDFADCTKKE